MQMLSTLMVKNKHVTIDRTRALKKARACEGTKRVTLMNTHGKRNDNDLNLQIMVIMV
jgi:hypothetical protein